MQFFAKENGYALLDITKALTGHITISCLFSGKLKFSLCKEIRILNEQALKGTFCEKIQDFITNGDIAYCICSDIDIEKYRYYLVVEGNGILDEVLIHDAIEEKDITKWHVKGIDILGFVTEEKETAAKTVDLEYSADFIKYFNLETAADGYLKPGTTVDWNITKVNEYDLNTVLTQHFLSRNNVWIAQSDSALIETKPIQVQYLKSVYRMAVTVNDLVDGNFKGFTIKAFASSASDGTYTQVASDDNTNILTFQVPNNKPYIKFQISAKEGKIVHDIDLFATYKENSTEVLPVFYYTQGSAVTKIFDIGAKGTYKFKEVLAEEDSTWNEIYIRALKESTNKELIWTTWQNVNELPEFTDCQLFQFKIIMNSSKQKAMINAFRFEVLSNV